MKNNHIQPLITFDVQSKGNKYYTQYLRTYKVFYQNPCTMKELEIKTGIDRANICRYVGKMRKLDIISVYKKAYCSITKRLVNQYTTNPDLKPLSNQLTLF